MSQLILVNLSRSQGLEQVRRTLSASYSWVFPGGNPCHWFSRQPGAVTYSTVGTYVASLTVTDLHSSTDPSPPTRTITVNGPPSITSPNITTFTVGTAGSFTVTTTGSPTPTVSESGSLPNAVTFKDNGNGTATIAGTPATGTAGTYPITICCQQRRGHRTPPSPSLWFVISRKPVAVSSWCSIRASMTGSRPCLPLLWLSPRIIPWATGLVWASGSGSQTRRLPSRIPKATPTTARPKSARPGTATLVAIFYAENIAAGANTVTVSVSSADTLRFAILEFSGVAPSGSIVQATANQGSNASPNSGSITETVNGDLLLGAIMSADEETFTAGSGFQIVESVPAAPNTKLIMEFQIQALSGSSSSSATLTSADPWAAGIAAFKPGTGGTSAPTITSANSANFAVNAAGSFTVTTTGSPNPTLSESGSLPSPVTFKDNGNGTATISGTPATGTAGTYSITITASNGVGTAATQSFTLTVNPALAITSANSTTFAVGTAGTFAVTTNRILNSHRTQ